MFDQQNQAEPQFDKALLLDENPINNVVASPDGRVFVNISIILDKLAMKWVSEAMLAQITGDETAKARVSGATQVLQAFLTAHDGSKVAVELQRNGEEITREKVMAGVDALNQEAKKFMESNGPLSGPSPFS